MLKILLTLILASFSFLCAIDAKQTSLTINIISRDLINGAGKEADVIILKSRLEILGHSVNLVDYQKPGKVSAADINIFLAQFHPKFFSRAKLNWFIPNAEFCTATRGDLKKFDLILCKTKECLEIFQPLAKRTYYLGFTSFDHYQPDVSKDFSKYLHVGGKSAMKGTDEVLQAWRMEAALPHLTLIKYQNLNDKKRPPKNVELISKRVSEKSILSLQNTCGVHICPSKTEGFGHYIMEAMSVGAVVVTTNAPPMNEFIIDPRCLVEYHHRGWQRYATIYTVDEQELINTVKSLQELSEEEMKMIGQRNREEFLRRKAEFEENFENLMEKTLLDLVQL